ncbi:unnamed protein product [Caenorhabditis angaria]|uniref:JmjC domain-containing protein n=1 Tax=Caenorhabditis angaria TaxID=860376 RepID=A0A9P1IHJ9_9PELO|nr:unnamed protein product [Caenorhabditis angaria]
MPPKRKSRGGGAAGRGGRGGKRGRRSKKDSTTEDERSSPEVEAKEFDKESLQRVVKYDFVELMNDPTFKHPEFVHTIDPADLNEEYYEKTGLDYPLHFRCDPKLLGMTLPDSSFTVDDVLEIVGGNRMIEVVEVRNQGSVKMNLQNFIDFYKTPEEKRDILYNVLSLEFSLTKLEDLVQSPSLVRNIDWVGNKWPDALRQRWISFGKDNNYTPHHIFPKVQNYCLMSVAKCYTDFHIDFSGTSVWYHVLKGKKVFWLIPPTETNFLLYQEFIQTVGDSSFFGKSVESCHCAILEPGDTMMIPSGWIHAVYTPEDSLVFGGNFLHSMSCKMQIRVYQCENRLNITRKFRLPYNEELVFYVLADYVKKWTGREYARPLRIKDATLDYVGEKWKKAGGHLKKIEYSDYQNGIELTNDHVPNGNEEHNEGEVKVIAMHAENTIYRLPIRPSRVDSCLEAEEDEFDEEQLNESFENDAEKRDAEIDELVKTNPLIFYKNSKHDFVKNKCVPDHKLPIGYEPPIEYNQEEIEKINPRLLEELEALGAYLKKKGKVEVSEGICQPASLLNAFQSVLKRRKMQLEGKVVEETITPKRKYTRGSVESGNFEITSRRESVEMMEECPRSASRFEVENFPDELLDDGEKPVKLEEAPMKLEVEKVEEPEEVETKRRSSRVAADKANHLIKDEIVEEMKEEGKTEEKTWREKMELEEKERAAKYGNQQTEKEPAPKKLKLTKEERKELKEREKERKRKNSSLDASLIAAHGMSKSKKKKPEKPLFQGGLPQTAITSTEPATSNPYNYDPMMEMVRLGTGQLKSAYRKTKTNVEVPFEKKMYKLETKRNSEENDVENVSMDDSQKSEEKDDSAQEKPTTKQPISIDIFDTPSSSTPIKKKEKPALKNVPKSPAPAPPRKSMYTPGISRQDRMIADDPTMTSPSVSRSSSMSEKRPANLGGTPRNSMDLLSSPSSVYTPTAPSRSSWIPDAISPMQQNSSQMSDSPIDVVNDNNLTPNDFSPPSSSSSLREIKSPIRPSSRKDERNGKGADNHNHARNDRSRRPSSTTPKIPTPIAIRTLQNLVTQLNELNDSC